MANPWDGHFSRDELDDIAHETRDIAGFEFPVDSGLSNIDGFDRIRRQFEQEDEFLQALLHQGEAMLQQIDEQRLRAQNTVDRAAILLEEGAISAEDAEEITTSAKIWELSMTDNRKKAESRLAQLNDDIHKFFQKTTRNIESLVKEGASVQRDEAKDASKKAAKDVQDIQERLDNNRTQEELIKKDSELHPERKAANDKRLQTLEEMDRKNINDLVHANKTVKDAAAAEQAAQEAYDASTFKRAITAFNTRLGQVFHSITDLWEDVKHFETRFHQAGELMTKGYKVYFNRFAQGAEDASAYWREANGFATEEAAHESAAYKKGLREITAAAEARNEDALMQAIAKYATPSSRVLIATDIEYAKLIEKDLQRLTPVPLFRAEWVGYNLKRATARLQSAGLSGLERIMGPEVVGGLIEGLGLVTEIAANIVEFYLGPEILIAELFGKITMELIRDGVTLKFLDDFLQHFFLSLEDFDRSLKLAEYPFEPHIADGAANDPSIRMLKFDASELALTMDFWGKEYIKFMGIKGHKYPAYKPMAKFKATVRVPGRYLKPSSLVSQGEIDENKRLESLLSLDQGEFNSRSLVDSWFPRQKGYVRNLREFPMYEQTMQWPDPNAGVPIQTAGFFVERDLDPTIVEAFKLWAVNGTHGPVYNSSTNRQTQLAAVQANKADLTQWLNPKISWPLAWNEVSEWVKTLHGKKGVMLGDMFNLAPKEWLKEWDVDLPLKQNKYFGFDDGRSGKFMTDLGYQDVKKKTGRYTYRPRDRKFLQDAINGTLMRAYDYDPWKRRPFEPEEIVEDYPDSHQPGHGWVAVRRKSTPADKAKYKAIMQSGMDWKQKIESKSKTVEDEWQQEALKVVWGDYVRVEKPRRTIWSYISKYRNAFIEELMYVVNFMAGKERIDAWKNYMQQIAGSHIPLQMNSEHRVTFMGMFAALAYPNDPVKDAKFISTLEKRFGKLLENDLVTTSPGWAKWVWTRGVHTVKVVTEAKGALDFPIMFGDLNARMFVLDKPRVMVIAIKGTSSATDWLIDADFSTGHFSTVKADRAKNSVDIHNEPKGSTKKASELTGDPQMMTVHRGFLRAAEALKPGIEKFMREYMDKYDDITDVFITGHSLGAAITQLMPMMLPRLVVKGKRTPLNGNGRAPSKMKNPNCYMFSSPAVGDERFVRHFDTWAGESAQVWIDGDAIVSVPPFLLPDREQSEVAFQKAKDSLRVLSGKGSAFNGSLYALHLMFKHTRLPPQIDLPALWRDFNTFDKRRFTALIAEIADAANENRALRAGQVFMRLDGIKGHGFTETTYDSGNSASVYYTLFNTPDLAAHFLALHKLENTVGLMSLVAKEHPDLFDIDAEDIPSWADGGIIDPDDPSNPHGHRVPKSIVDRLKDGTAHIVGYGKSQHYHKPWTMVPKEDVVEESGVWMADDSEIISGLEHSRSVKRRKVDKSDHTYRGNGYL
jgi:hypothetical protein